MPKDWESAKPHIERLYMRENRALSEVVRLMRTEYGFKASVRAYRMRLSDWDYQKNANRKSSENQKRAISSKSSDIVPIQQIQQTKEPITQSKRFPETVQFDSRSIFASYAPITTDTSHEFGQVSSFLSTHDVQPEPSSTSFLTHGYFKTLQHLQQAITNRSLKEVTDCLSWNSKLARERDRTGNTAIHYAAHQGATEIIEPLVERGADINSIGNSRRTPLHLATTFPKTLEAIITFGPIISPQDADGNTPLHLLVKACNMDEPLEGSGIELLVRAGAEINAINNLGESPFYLLITKLSDQGKHQKSYVLLFLENTTNFDDNAPDGEPLWSYLLRKTEFRWSKPDFNILTNSRNRDVMIALSKSAFCPSNWNRCILQTTLSTGILDDGHDYELGQYLCRNAPILCLSLNKDNELHCLFKMANSPGLKHYEKSFQILLYRASWKYWNTINNRGETPLEALILSERSTTEAKLAFLKTISKNSEVDLWLDCENHPIYSATRLGEVGEPIVTFMLEEGRRKYQSHTLNSPSYWLRYYKLIQSGNYFLLEEWYEKSTISIPADIRDKLRSISCSYAAEALLTKAKRKFIEYAAPSNHIVEILRICRRFSIRVDPSWYEYLLDLFE